VADTIWGSTSKPVSSKKLADTIESIDELEGTLYIGYPILGTPTGAFPFDAALITPDHGVVVFDVVEGPDVGDFEKRQDEFYTRLQSKLIQYPDLLNKRQLQVEITVVTFAPRANIGAIEQPEGYVVLGTDDLEDFLEGISWDSPARYPSVVAALQSLSSIRKGRKRREVAREDSRGGKIRKLEDSIANLDLDQGAAVIETVDGVQRIRGLAGSGKTIVLALKVAYLHAQNPSWKIAVTFLTRSLKGQFERLINSFVFEQTNDEPDWERIDILQGWGAPGGGHRTGIYYKFCEANGVRYYDFKSAQDKYGSTAFESVCQEALDSAKDIKQIYDAILVDEAQDFSPQFLRLCYAFLKEPKRLVYAYDELQSLTDTSLPPPSELFGTGPDGKPLVVFAEQKPGEPKQDIILERCYRNSRPVLTTAHALGFGIYRKPGGLIQLFDEHHLWRDVGYSVHSGELADDQFVSLERTPESSPKFLESHSAIDDLITFKSFETQEAQNQWLVEQIEKNIREDELFPEDIVVINPDPLKTRAAVSGPRSALFSKGINSSLAGVSSSPDIFFENDVVTFTGIFRAKGNEAAMVYIINADDCFTSLFPANLARARNQLFTAITRAKAWVRVLGVGPNMDALANEYDEVKAKEFRLEFVYPNAEKRKDLRIINRDVVSPKKISRSKKAALDLEKILDAIDSGEISVEELSPAIRRRLERLARGEK
jgi:superfamily I DNA and RNA helicase